jgi:hypothetical protein
MAGLASESDETFCSLMLPPTTIDRLQCDYGAWDETPCCSFTDQYEKKGISKSQLLPPVSLVKEGDCNG